MAQPLNTVPVGTIVKFSDKEWMILEHLEDGTTYIILNGNDGNKMFDHDNTNKFNPNDSNNIGHYLNNDFYNNLSQKELIKEYLWDLKNETGVERYLGVSCKMALISHAEYSKYKSLFPSGGTGYTLWTRTPHSDVLNATWVIGSNGSLIGNSSNASHGICPVLYLQSGLGLSETNGVVVIPKNKYLIKDSANKIQTLYNPRDGEVEFGELKNSIPAEEDFVNLGMSDITTPLNTPVIKVTHTMETVREEGVGTIYSCLVDVEKFGTINKIESK